MKKPILVLIILFIFSLSFSCNSSNKNDSHTSFEISSEGNTYLRFFEMDGISSDGKEYRLNVIYGYSINNGTGIVLNKRKAKILHSFVTETVTDYITVKLSAKLSHEIMELKQLNSDLEHGIIENLDMLNEAIEDQNVKVFKLDLTRRN